MSAILAERPFLEHWDFLWQLEVRRKQGDFHGQGMEMVLHFMNEIGYEEFLKHARRTTAIVEIAKFYENSLRTSDDLAALVALLQKNYYHSEAFVYGVYFAAWVKEEVSEAKRAFKVFDRQIEGQIEQGGSIQLMIREIVKNQITFTLFVDTFKASNVNGIYNFLKRKNIIAEEDFSKLDDIEARHLMDQILMYSSLREMRLHQVQARLGIFLSTTDQRQRFGFTPCCMPED